VLTQEDLTTVPLRVHEEFISVIIPAFNEEEAISGDLEKIFKVMDAAKFDYEVIVVDDGSTDHTAQVVRQYPRAQLIQHPKNRGTGAATNTAIRRARGEIIAMTDGDGTYPVQDIPRLLDALEGYDMVIGARVREAATEPGDARRQLQRIVATQLRFSQENGDVLRFYLTGWTGYEFAVRQLFGDRIDTKYEQYLDVLVAVFRRGIREGTFVAAPPRRLAIAVAGMIHALIRRWLREKTLNLLVEGEALVQLVVYGAAHGARNGDRR